MSLAGHRRRADLVRVATYRLRQKMEEDPAKPALLHTMSGVGLLIRNEPAA